MAFGHGGLRVYDWDLDVVWEFSNEFGEVSQCYLEHGVIFFMTCNGKLFLYDFLGNFKELIFEYAKPTYNVLMLVYPERKYVTKKSKLILIDRLKLVQNSIGGGPAQDHPSALHAQGRPDAGQILTDIVNYCFVIIILSILSSVNMLSL